MKNILFQLAIVFVAFQSGAQENITEQFINQAGEKTTIYNSVVLETSPIQKSISWAPEVRISEHLNEDSRDMSIAMGPDSTLHVVYVDDVPGYPGISRQRITYTNKPYGGNWSTPMIIDEFNGITPRNNHEASINVSDNGDVHVVFHYWAYDGTGRNQIGYSHYNKQTDTWSTEIISGAVGTVFATYSDYPRITSTNNNIPVVVWGNDERNGADYDEAFLSYNNGTWQTPIEISSSDTTQAQFPRPVSIGSEKVFIVFQEKNKLGDTVSLYYRTFDVTTAQLTPIQKIAASERPSSYSYYNFDATYLGNDSVFIALNVKDTIISFTYDAASDLLTQNPSFQYTNLTSAYPNYHLLSITADNNSTVHLAYDVWNLSSNTPSLYYQTYDYVNHFSTPELFSNHHAIDEPHIIYGRDNILHIVYCDESEDTNNDGYVDREVYYTNSADVLNVISIETENITIYPNPSTSGVFNISTNNEIKKYVVYSISGKKILEKTNTPIIDLSTQNKGIYFLEIETERGIQTIKIIH